MNGNDPTSASSASARGRPAYQPSEKDRRIVEAMSGWAMPQERIAKVLGCDPKTLRKHFAAELEVGSARLEAQLAQNLLRIAQGSDRQALIATIFALKSRFGWVEAVAPLREREYPLGKKEKAELVAHHAGEDTGWGDLLKPREAPAIYRVSGAAKGRGSAASADAGSWEELLRPDQRN